MIDLRLFLLIFSFQIFLQTPTYIPDYLPSVEVIITRQSNRAFFVCLISLTSGQLINELLTDCTRSCFSQVVLRRRCDDHIYEIRCLFVAVGLNARFIVLPHWDNMS